MHGIRSGVVLAVLAMSAHGLAAQQHGMMGDTTMAQQQMRMMDSMNTRLEMMAGRMNMATGSRKVTAMADVINEMIAQRKAMQARMRLMMSSRRGMMMEGMMGGPPAAGTEGPPAPDSTAADTGHAGHHPP